MTELRLLVPEGGGGRADRLAADLSGLSRSRVQKLIEDGHLTVDGQPVRARTAVAPGTVLVLEVPEPVPAGIEAEPIPLSVVHEDADVLVVDKPAGLVVHPSPGHWSGTLVNALLARSTEYGGIAGVQRPGIVHRLDRDTSGLLIVAKTDLAQASLMAQLKARRVKKTYLALVAGSVESAVGRIEGPIGRDPANRKRMAVVPNGRPATTGYRVRERLPGWTLLEVDLVTGRTHQIRVHLAAIGHPVAGDQVYGTGTARRGPDGLERLFLHAWRLVFSSPSTGDLVRLEAPLPDGLEAALAGLRFRAAAAEGRVGPLAPDAAILIAADPASPATSVEDDGQELGSPPVADDPLLGAPAQGAPGALLVVVSGPSGVGKDTIIAALRARPRQPDYHYVVTCTTRAPRPGEVDGVSYHFLARDRFAALRKAGAFLEAAEVHRNWYATPRAEVRRALAAGHDVILKIDVQGAAAVKAAVPDALLVFVVPPSLEALFARLVSRATETAEELEVRQRNAALELARQGDYDHVVVNETGQV
ncbi:MAG: pseudouridine synthase, RluA family, partial [Chloroflexi bacterium]|nr:pseudouridine synthase, RluA family [Chloroflexota bacterium]